MQGFIVFKLVGVARFELATSRPPDARATRLRYTPNISLMGLKAYAGYINDLCFKCNEKTRHCAQALNYCAFFPC